MRIIDQSDKNEETKSKTPSAGKGLLIPAEEINDSKHSKTIAHRSQSPRYDKDGKITHYSIGNYTQSYLKKLKENKKKKQAN